MSGFISIGREARQKMLNSVGTSIEQLFAHIPENLRVKQEKFEALRAEGLSELEVVTMLKEMAAENKGVDEYDSYLGAGFYDHYIPSAIKHITGRQEYLTSYTPYQQEISQGTLQTIFEWQSYICRLTGMDVSNSSMYDGPSAAAEAVLMAFREKTKSKKVWISAGVSPDSRDTIKTYLHGQGFEIEYGELSANSTASGTYPTGDGYAAFVVQSPNFFGVLEDLTELSEKAHAANALAIAGCDPVSLALFKTPGSCGIDIAYGEAQPLGSALSFGGPGIGYLATTDKLLRKMPGRIAGATVDRNGKTAYVLTIQAREQHIRRERATSNICTSQALLATTATIYLSLMGREGLKAVAEQSAAKAYYLHDALIATGLFEDLNPGAAFFREFALKAKEGLCLKKLNERLLEDKIIGGPVLEGNVWLLAVTEKKSKKAMDNFVAKVQALASELMGGVA